MSEVTKTPAAESARKGDVYTPAFDVWESAEEIVLYGDLPGVAREDLDLRFEDNELTVHGKVAARNEGMSYLINEYGVGDFCRTFAVSEVIDVDKISAELKAGVLTIHLPKSSAVKPRKIDVQGA